MALVGNGGGAKTQLGPWIQNVSTVSTFATALDSTDEAVVMYGQIITADGLPHTLNTAGSSSIGIRTGPVTHVDPTTTVKVGLCQMDLAAGPPARPVMVGNAITFNVSRAVPVGGFTTSVWHTFVPDTGSLVVNNGDQLGLAIQMGVRGGTDSISISNTSVSSAFNSPSVSTFVSPTWSAGIGSPNAIITFSDGTLGWFYTADILSTTSVRTFNNVANPREYGSLFNMPYPYRVYGVYGLIATTGDFEFNLYSDPLGTPVAERIITPIDSNAVSTVSARYIFKMFSSPYDVPKDTPVAIALKSLTATSITLHYKTFAVGAHRVTDMAGLSSYGVQRAAGASFVDGSGTLTDAYYLGLLVSAYEAGGTSGGGGSGSYHDRLGL